MLECAVVVVGRVSSGYELEEEAAREVGKEAGGGTRQLGATRELSITASKPSRRCSARRVGLVTADASRDVAGMKVKAG
jgi:hypothetical protein